MTIEDYDGTTILDAAGERIGKIERSYDDADGRVHLVEVQIGHLLHKHRLVPVEDVQEVEGGLQVPYSRQTVLDSPDAKDVDGKLEGDLLQMVRAYYAGNTVNTQGISEPVDTDADDVDRLDSNGTEPGSVPV